MRLLFRDQLRRQTSLLDSSQLTNLLSTTNKFVVLVRALLSGKSNDHHRNYDYDQIGLGGQLNVSLSALTASKCLVLSGWNANSNKIVFVTLNCLRWTISDERHPWLNGIYSQLLLNWVHWFISTTSFSMLVWNLNRKIVCVTSADEPGWHSWMGSRKSVA